MTFYVVLKYFNYRKDLSVRIEGFFRTLNEADDYAVEQASHSYWNDGKQCDVIHTISDNYLNVHGEIASYASSERDGYQDYVYSVVKFDGDFPEFSTTVVMKYWNYRKEVSVRIERFFDSEEEADEYARDQASRSYWNDGKLCDITEDIYDNHLDVDGQIASYASKDRDGYQDYVYSVVKHELKDIISKEYSQ